METKTNSPIKAPFQMSFSEWLAAYGERLTEAKERRSEMGKVFQLGENHFRTVIYPEAVHYWDAANKVYRSIDNRLVGYKVFCHFARHFFSLTIFNGIVSHFSFPSS